MINANELRRGNWVLPEHNLDGNYHCVKELGDKSINGYIEDWYSPIPLTPEILEKCGAVKNGVTAEWNSKMQLRDRDLYLLSDDYELIVDTEFNCINFYIPSQDIGQQEVRIACAKYLHQLQNLYFALTEQELNVNINVESYQ